MCDLNFCIKLSPSQLLKILQIRGRAVGVSNFYLHATLAFDSNCYSQSHCTPPHCHPGMANLPYLDSKNWSVKLEMPSIEWYVCMEYQLVLECQLGRVLCMHGVPVGAHMHGVPVGNRSYHSITLFTIQESSVLQQLPSAEQKGLAWIMAAVGTAAALLG